MSVVSHGVGGIISQLNSCKSTKSKYYGTKIQVMTIIEYANSMHAHMTFSKTILS